jgi:hypothetical protein
MAKLPEDLVAGWPPNDARLEREEVEAGLRFAFRGLAAALERVAALEGELAGLRAAALASGAVTDAGLAANRPAPARSELLRVAKGPNKYCASSDIDCEERRPICQAICCQFRVSLSEQDLDERVLAWDYGHPYELRRGADAYCVYFDRQRRRCGIYMHRPLQCRIYTCRTDERIWQDFDRRELKKSWDPEG